MAIQHTPTPYEIANTHVDNGRWVTSILDANGEFFMQTYGSDYRSGYADEGQSWEKAEAIVRACNAHELLISAAKEALEFIEKRTRGIVIDAKDALRIAISKSEGK